MRKAAGALLALALVVAACGGDADDAEQAGESPTAPGAVTTTADGSQPPSAGGEDSEGAAGAGAGGGGPSGTTNQTPRPGSSTTSAGRPAAQLNASGPPGSFADELLGARTGDRLQVEIMQQSGAEPRSRSIEHLVDVLASVSGKAVEVGAPIAVPGGAQRWTPDSLVRTAAAHAQADHGGGTVVLRLLFLRGSFAPDDSVLGVSFRADAAAVFADKVNEAATLGIGGSQIERAVVTHEAGHLLGLVDLFLDTGRDDPEHPGHSTNPGSVMYWAVESDVVGQVLTGGPPDQFDQQDRADLARIRSA